MRLTISFFWGHLLKGVKTSDSTANKVFVVIAAIYDLTTPKSPVVFSNYPHLVPHFTKEETTGVVDIYARPLGISSWGTFLENLKKLAFLPDENCYHVGVVIAGFFLIQGLKKRAHQQQDFFETRATELLRSDSFSQHLNRCYGLPTDDNGIHQHSYDIADAVLRRQGSSAPLVLRRTGILNSQGQFASMAAWWYYNRVCFPNRALAPPDSLDDLVVGAVKLMSAKRLSDTDTMDNGFPKEATFQHLFNEAMSVLLPVHNYLVPEFNTFALDEDGEPAHGELDFYINGTLQWCLELLRNGDKIGEHLGRFEENTGKYREVQQKSYLVVDCRGPKLRAITPDEARCTLYFAEDFRSCRCKMRMNEEITINLNP